MVITGDDYIGSTIWLVTNKLGGSRRSCGIYGVYEVSVLRSWEVDGI